MSREDLHFRLRIPEALKKRIEAAAEQSRRSITAEIVAALEDAYPEGMGIGEFAEQFLTPIAKAKSEHEKDQLVEVANRAAEAANSSFRARAVLEPDGQYTAEGYMAGGDGRSFVKVASLF